MSKKQKDVRVRIAPSPTGDPHVGTAYIALFNRTFARTQQGKFILRIEDTDQVRSEKKYEKQILSTLKWLGLTWDEGPDIGGDYGPYRQSERQDLYRKHVQQLVDKGKAYPCFCTPERLAELRKSQGKGPQTGYDGKCRSISPAEAKKRLEKEGHVIRLKVPSKGSTQFEDFFRGPITWENTEVDDQVLLKSDGFPTYHLASVVDDHLMKITHVIRAEEWISSTPKHILLYEAFGWEAPEFCHMPLLRNQDSSKISKRKNPCSLHYYRKNGILPEALLNFLGLQGYSMPDEREKFTLEDFEKDFDLKRIKTRGPVFDLAKLYHINGLYLHEMPEKKLSELVSKHLKEWLKETMPLAQKRLESLSDYIPVMTFLFLRPEKFHPQLNDIIPKKISLEDAQKVLGDFQKIYGECPWDLNSIEEATKDYCKRSSLKQGPLYMTLRIGITGRLDTPPLMETLALMERFSVLERLGKTLEDIQKM